MALRGQGSLQLLLGKTAFTSKKRKKGALGTDDSVQSTSKRPKSGSGSGATASITRRAPADRPANRPPLGPRHQLPGGAPKHLPPCTESHQLPGAGNHLLSRAPVPDGEGWVRVDACVVGLRFRRSSSGAAAAASVTAAAAVAAVATARDLPPAPVHLSAGVQTVAATAAAAVAAPEPRYRLAPELNNPQDSNAVQVLLCGPSAPLITDGASGAAVFPADAGGPAVGIGPRPGGLSSQDATAGATVHGSHAAAAAGKALVGYLPAVVARHLGPLLRAGRLETRVFIDWSSQVSPGSVPAVVYARPLRCGGADAGWAAPPAAASGPTAEAASPAGLCTNPNRPHCAKGVAVAGRGGCVGNGSDAGCCSAAADRAISSHADYGEASGALDTAGLASATTAAAAMQAPAAGAVAAEAAGAAAQDTSGHAAAAGMYGGEGTAATAVASMVARASEVPMAAYTDAEAAVAAALAAAVAAAAAWWEARSGPSAALGEVLRSNFALMVEDVRRYDGHLLSESEHALLSRLLALPAEPQCLFLRLLLRRGPWFALSGIAYPECGPDVAAAAVELVAAGLADRPESQDWPQVAEMLPVVEVRALVSELQQRQPPSRASILAYTRRRDPSSSGPTAEAPLPPLAATASGPWGGRRAGAGNAGGANCGFARKVHCAGTAGGGRRSSGVGGGTPHGKAAAVEWLRKRCAAGDSANVAQRVETLLGPCIRLSPPSLELVARVQRLYFLAEGPAADLGRFLAAQRGVIRYPAYTIRRSSSAFGSRQQLLDYERALAHAVQLEASLEAGDDSAAAAALEPALAAVWAGAHRAVRWRGDAIIPVRTVPGPWPWEEHDRGRRGTGAAGSGDPAAAAKSDVVGRGSTAGAAGTRRTLLGQCAGVVAGGCTARAGVGAGVGAGEVTGNISKAAQSAGAGAAAGGGCANGGNGASGCGQFQREQVDLTLSTDDEDNSSDGDADGEAGAKKSGDSNGNGVYNGGAGGSRHAQEGAAAGAGSAGPARTPAAQAISCGPLDADAGRRAGASGTGARGDTEGEGDCDYGNDGWLLDDIASGVVAPAPMTTPWPVGGIVTPLAALCADPGEGDPLMLADPEGGELDTGKEALGGGEDDIMYGDEYDLMHVNDDLSTVPGHRECLAAPSITGSRCGQEPADCPPSRRLGCVAATQPADGRRRAPAEEAGAGDDGVGGGLQAEGSAAAQQPEPQSEGTGRPQQQPHQEPVHFLARFCAAWVHASMCTVGVSLLERHRRYGEAVALLRQLLQGRCCPGRRGEWWQRMSVDLQHLGREEEALQVAEAALSDPWVRHGDRLALQRRVLRLGKPPRRWKRPPWAAAALAEPREVVVAATMLRGTTGYKSRFVAPTTDQPNTCGGPTAATSVMTEPGAEATVGPDALTGSLLGDCLPDPSRVPPHPVSGPGSGVVSPAAAAAAPPAPLALVSVEKLALLHYGSAAGGGWRGVHSEGGVWLTLWALLMWDVVFMDVPEVFRSPSQTHPLDLDTDAFLPARREAVDRRLQAIAGGGAPELLRSVWSARVGTRCRGVSWDRLPLEDLVDIARCVGGLGLSVVCRLLCEDAGGWQGGMPDLLLWRPDRGDAMVSEVKGPRDRLSDQQRAWLAALAAAEVRTEVLRVVEAAPGEAIQAAPAAAADDARGSDQKQDAAAGTSGRGTTGGGGRRGQAVRGRRAVAVPVTLGGGPCDGGSGAAGGNGGSAGGRGVPGSLAQNAGSS